MFGFHPGWFLFLGFSILVVHVCQWLVEHAALAISESERKAQFARSALCIGTLVWSLDALGLFFYQNMNVRGARLAPALFSLMVMAFFARITVPALVTTRVKRWVLVAGVLLAVGMLMGHFLLVSAMGKLTGVIRWNAGLLAVLITTVLACGLALRHRSLRLTALSEAVRPLPWIDKVLGGIAILPLHWALTASVPLEPLHMEGRAGGPFPVLLALVLFGFMIAITRVHDVEAEVRQQGILNRALALVRSVRDLPKGVDGQCLSLIAERIDSVLDESRIEMHYQPIVPLGSRTFGVRFEALMRAEDPDLGSINPEMLFLACERMGRAVWADRQVLQHVLRTTRDWCCHREGCDGLSVNVAPDTLLEPGFVPWLSGELAHLGVPHWWLQLEITEHSMISASDDLVRVLKELDSLGIGVVLDDFGAGFSSLSVLVDLPLKGIKLDRALITHLTADSARQALVRHICAMAKDLHVRVTVEGIEQAGELALVAAHGADSVQGYFLARPMPGKAVPGWLRTHNVKPKDHPLGLVPAEAKRV